MNDKYYDSIKEYLINNEVYKNVITVASIWCFFWKNLNRLIFLMKITIV